MKYSVGYVASFFYFSFFVVLNLPCAETLMVPASTKGIIRSSPFGIIKKARTSIPTSPINPHVPLLPHQHKGATLYKRSPPAISSTTSLKVATPFDMPTAMNTPVVSVVHDIYYENNCQLRTLQENVDVFVDTPPSPPRITPVESIRRRRWTTTTQALLQRYEESCERRPLITKSVTSAIITAVGNALSQVMRSVIRGTTSVAAATSSSGRAFNCYEFATFALAGLFYIGPFYHYWFEKLWHLGDWMTARFGSSKANQVYVQVLIDQTIGLALFMPMYYIVLEVFESLVVGRVPVPQAAYIKCINTIRPVLIANWRIWPFVNYINFRYIPQHMRLLTMSTVSIMWNILIGFLIA